MSYDNMLPKWRILPKEYLSNVCFLLADCYLWKWYLIEGGGDDSVIASNQARNGTCRFTKATMMRWWRRWLGMLGAAFFPQDRARQLFRGGAGQWSKSTGQGKAMVVPFRGGAKTTWTNYKVSVSRSFWTNVYIFVILFSVFLGAGQGGAEQWWKFYGAEQAFSFGLGRGVH